MIWLRVVHSASNDFVGCVMNSETHLYVSVRDGSRVHREYIGPKKDELVHWYGRKRRLSRAESLASKMAWRRMSEQLVDLADTITAFSDQLGAVTKAWLQTQAFRINRKGELSRIVRIGAKGIKMPATYDKDTIEVLVRKSENGDANALAELRKVLWDDRETWCPFGDLYEHVSRTYLSLMTRGNVLAGETLRMNLAELRCDLESRCGNNSVLKLAAQQVVLCYLDFHYHQSHIPEPSDLACVKNDIERRLDRSQKRYNRALESLERLEKVAEAQS